MPRVGLCYEGLPWFTGAAAAAIAPFQACRRLPSRCSNSIGAHGIDDSPTTSKGRSRATARMGPRQPAVLLGEGRAARLACWVMAVPQLAVIGLLPLLGLFPYHAGAVGLLLLLQLAAWRGCCAIRSALPPPGSNATGTTLYVLGMLVTALRTEVAGRGCRLMDRTLGWIAIFRLGPRPDRDRFDRRAGHRDAQPVMVVELSLAATIPGLLVGLHYGVQLLRPLWGHAYDVGGRRTRWIVGGMFLLGLGAAGASVAVAVNGPQCGPSGSSWPFSTSC